MRVLMLCLCALLTTAPCTGYGALVGSYLPGEPVSFVFKLPPVSNLGSYNAELLLTSPSGVAGTDFYFDVAATLAATSKYVFPSTEYFFTAVNVLPSNTHSLTLSDFSEMGVDVEAGVNDEIGLIVFRTSPSFSGLLSLSLAEETFQLDTPASTPTSVPEYAGARSALAAEIDTAVAAVPEPKAMFLIAISLATFAYRCRSTA